MTTFPPRPLALALVLVAVLGAQTARAGKLYKWVDEKGVTHYSETIPADQKDRSSTEIDRRGRVLRHNPAAPSAAEREAQQAETERRMAEERRAQEQRRRDTALINTYTNESEIDDARKRAVATAEQAREALEARWRSVQARADTLRRQVASLRQAGTAVPDSTREELAAAETSASRLAADLKARQAEISALQQKYEADRQRYIELRSGNQPRR